jgi:FtsP/CotA-like multicopper oxidase with cupredoxin domain
MLTRWRRTLGGLLAHPLAVAMIAVGVLGSSTGVIAARAADAERPASCVEPNRRMTLHAVQLPSAGKAVRLAYGLTPQTASIPGPTIEMVEGDCLAITVVNDIPASTLAKVRNDPVLGSRDPKMPLGVSLHVHGVKYTQASDGTLETGSWVRPGSVRTYTWFAAPRTSTAGRVTSQGTAGYWWYHDHIVGTSHGTGGAASGLFGAVIVRRPGDVAPDRTYVVGMGGNTTLNLRDFPDCRGEPSLAKASNTCYVALPGELVEFAVIAFGDDFHTFHLHGHNWAENRTGILTGPADDTRLVDNRTIGPADTFGFIIRAGEEVGPGHWMLHCHVQTHSDTGMTTFLHILGATAEAPDHHRT